MILQKKKKVFLLLVLSSDLLDSMGYLSTTNTAQHDCPDACHDKENIQFIPADKVKQQDGSSGCRLCKSLFVEKLMSYFLVLIV